VSEAIDRRRLPGLDTVSVTDWFAQHIDDDRELRFELVANGRSNLTYLVGASSGRRWILRRPPEGVLHASAHDVSREHRIMRALEGTGVPVPGIVGHCESLEVTGAPFYVMDFVDGVVMDAGEAIESLGQVERDTFVEQFGATLAAIHSVDPVSVGLGDLVRHRPLVRRQLRRWSSQLLDRTDAIGRTLLALHGRLSDSAPVTDLPVLVHGDYRPGNVIVAPDGSIAAVLDWELAAAGDGMTDLGWLAAWWARGVDWTPSAHLPEGSLDRVLDAYVSTGGASVERLSYYQSFAYWRLACIALGVYERYASGAMGKSPESLAALEQKPVRFADMARAQLD
jgi:aminoglycoside phosphotransferase (APT) family kinase protein